MGFRALGFLRALGLSRIWGLGFVCLCVCVCAYVRVVPLVQGCVGAVKVYGLRGRKISERGASGLGLLVWAVEVWGKGRVPDEAFG